MAKRAADIVQVKVRMRADMHRGLAKDAERHGQTLNAEILKRLERSFGSDIITATIERTAEVTADAVVRRLIDEAIIEGANRQQQPSAATNEQTKSQEAGVVNLMDALRRQMQAGEQSSAATNKETKKRTGTEDKS